ncbi:hypothetical protein [Methylobacterium sp. 77]|uniref:hypothetical protein n=1 Tax=Methylobacterium sp. 77 TaxID=1101192 RepID=UPI001FDA3EC9|nr:hypothetical protein [Methylobacterium sp. 77]
MWTVPVLKAQAKTDPTVVDHAQSVAVAKNLEDTACRLAASKGSCCPEHRVSSFASIGIRGMDALSRDMTHGRRGNLVAQLKLRRIEIDVTQRSRKRHRAATGRLSTMPA